MSSKSILELLDLSHRVTLITGGGGHIGSMFARSLAQIGSNIVLVDKDLSALESAKKSIVKGLDIDVLTITADLEDEDCYFQIVDTFLGICKIDVLINNAAFGGSTALEGWATSFDKQSLVTWRRALEVNLTSAFALSQACQFLQRNRHPPQS